MNEMEYTTSNDMASFDYSPDYPMKSPGKGIYGSFHYQDNDNGEITIDPDWVSDNIVEVTLSGVNKTVQIHKLAVENFRKAFQIIATKEVDTEEGKKTLKDLVKTVGTFAQRHVRNSSALSNHSWGIAIDINEDDYPMGKGVDIQANPNDYNNLLWVHAFKPSGFKWGNNYNNRKDPMHFELA
jgi:hypothetical protein